jgi:hypothetical protein
MLRAFGLVADRDQVMLRCNKGIPTASGSAGERSARS